MELSKCFRRHHSRHLLKILLLLTIICLNFVITIHSANRSSKIPKLKSLPLNRREDTRTVPHNDDDDVDSYPSSSSTINDNVDSLTNEDNDTTNVVNGDLTNDNKVDIELSNVNVDNNDTPSMVDKTNLLIKMDNEDDFCWDNYVDSAYFNGYDTILTRGNRLWYYYKDQHRISRAYDQRRFTQGKQIFSFFFFFLVQYPQMFFL